MNEKNPSSVRTAALIGAGAVGCYFISYLQPALGNNFSILAEGDRLEKLKKGVIINGRNVPIHAVAFDDAAPVDLLIIATKYNALRSVLSQAARLVGPNTVILSVLNGIDSEDIVGEALGREHVVRCFMRIVAARKPEGVTFNAEKTPGLFFGEEDGNKTARIESLDAFFAWTGLHATVSSDIRTAQWDKFAINITNNLVQAVLGVGYGAYHESEHVGALRAGVTEEVLAVAACENIRLSSIPTGPEAAPKPARYSTLQDIDAGRPTETDMFLGTLLALANKHGLKLPYCEYTYHALKALEEKNEGKFNW